MFIDVINAISAWTIPVVLVLIPLYAIVKGVRVYEVFVSGAKEGFTIAVRIIPYLVAIMVAIGMFRSSGAIDLFVGILAPVARALAIPPEVLPVAFIRPLSGSGSLGVLSDIMKTYGTDGMIGKIASTMVGSSETTFYVLALYFGAVGIRKTRHTLPACLVADFFGVLISVYTCLLVFR